MSARSLLAGLAASAVVASATTMLALAPAQADPSSTPDANDLVGVGSDTTEFAMDYLADGTNGVAGYNAGKTAADPSWSPSAPPGPPRSPCARARPRSTARSARARARACSTAAPTTPT